LRLLWGMCTWNAVGSWKIRFDVDYRRTFKRVKSFHFQATLANFQKLHNTQAYWVRPRWTSACENSSFNFYCMSFWKNQQRLPFLFTVSQMRPVQDDYVRKTFNASESTAKFWINAYQCFFLAGLFHCADKAQLCSLVHTLLPLSVSRTGLHSNTLCLRKEARLEP